MKTKISPEEYKDILDKLDVKNINLLESRAKFSKEYLAKDIELDIKEKVKQKQDDHHVEFIFQYTLKGKSPDMSDPALEIMTKYSIVYSKSVSFEIKEEFFEPFIQFILKMMVWTFFREYVQNTVIRMNLPPLTLPLKRL